MKIFQTTTHLTQILEESAKHPVILFKYSNECNSSEQLKEVLQKKILSKTISSPIYLITVQTQRVLSDKIAEWFGIKHESPQVFVIDSGKVVYIAHHKDINPEML